MDLYVLERAFASTHPASEPLFASVLAAYQKRMGKDWPAVGRRLDEGDHSLHIPFLLKLISTLISSAEGSEAKLGGVIEAGGSTHLSKSNVFLPRTRRAIRFGRCTPLDLYHRCACYSQAGFKRI